MTRLFLIFSLTVLALTLAGCGKKGELRPPPGYETPGDETPADDEDAADS